MLIDINYDISTTDYNGVDDIFERIQRTGKTRFWYSKLWMCIRIELRFMFFSIFDFDTLGSKRSNCDVLNLKFYFKKWNEDRILMRFRGLKWYSGCEFEYLCWVGTADIYWLNFWIWDRTFPDPCNDCQLFGRAFWWPERRFEHVSNCLVLIRTVDPLGSCGIISSPLFIWFNTIHYKL